MSPILLANCPDGGTCARDVDMGPVLVPCLVVSAPARSEVAVEVLKIAVVVRRLPARGLAHAPSGPALALDHIVEPALRGLALAPRKVLDPLDEGVGVGSQHAPLADSGAGPWLVRPEQLPRLGEPLRAVQPEPPVEARAQPDDGVEAAGTPASPGDHVDHDRDDRQAHQDRILDPVQRELDLNDHEVAERDRAGDDGEGRVAEVVHGRLVVVRVCGCYPGVTENEPSLPDVQLIGSVPSAVLASLHGHVPVSFDLRQGFDPTCQLEPGMPLRETIDRIRSLPVPPNEESTKVQAVLPTLTALGWDQADPNRVQLEYNAGDKSKKRRIDIALIGRPHVVAFIEVKAPGQKLDDHLDQVLEYAFRVGVDICALTDGLEWWFYLPREKGPPESRRFEVLDIKSDSTERVAASFENYLSREELLGHRSEERAKQALRVLRDLTKLRKRTPEVWRGMQTDPDQELIELVTRRVHEKTRLQPAPELIISVLRGDPLPDDSGYPVGPPPDPVDPRPTSGDAKPGKSKTPPRKRRPPGPSPTGFRLWGKYHSATTHRAVLAGVASALFEKHGGEFEKALELRGRKLPWVSTDPTELRSASGIMGSSYFIDVHLSAKAIERRCSRLLGVFGHNSGDLEILFD
ncbi:MAG: hypothetical protein F4020_08190 [Gammaproteobacteria bacterium]|nr:hypothetical protein [Gammaproteobacteria bacterium]